ncbi:MAG: hypothetical protein QNJ70_32255, partial [Xenococcaceae cyanobacterium MO_207.B15]|nr:hypothetical protein [Xenococcaceae cyanobacterium MO_207.B15]
SNKLPVLSIAFVTGELIEPAGLPVLKVYRTEDSYVLGEGTELVISILNESLSHLGKNDHTVLFLAVDIVPVTSKTRRTRGGAE